MKHHERCPRCRYTHAEVMGCRPSKTTYSMARSISLPTREPLLSSRENSSHPHPQIRRPLGTTEEEDSTRSLTPDSSKNVALSGKEPSREGSQRHVSWPSQGDVASIEEVDRWIIPPTAEEKEESRRKKEAARAALIVEK